MNREQLLDRATQYIAWLNKNPSDAETLSTLMARDISIPVPYPGATPTFEGSVKFMKALHAALADVHFEILDACIDEVQHSVTVLANVTGTHVGFGFPLTVADGAREWLGVAGTGKKVDNKCFIMMRVCGFKDRVDISLTLKVD